MFRKFLLVCLLGVFGFAFWASNSELCFLSRKGKSSKASGRRLFKKQASRSRSTRSRLVRRNSTKKSSRARLVRNTKKRGNRAAGRLMANLRR